MPNDQLLFPNKECPWTTQQRTEHLWWEIGGTQNNGSYCIIASAHFQVVTVGLKSEQTQKDYDHLYIRAGGLDAYNFPLIPEYTAFIFLDRKGLTTRSLMSWIKWKGEFDELEILLSCMTKEANPNTPSEAKTFIQANLKRDIKSLITIPPYQQHKFVFRGLKLGESFDKWEPAKSELFEEITNHSGYSLSNDYKKFILETNGGHLKNKVFFEAKGLRKPRQIRSFTRFIKDGDIFTHPDEYKLNANKSVLLIGLDEKNEPLLLGLEESIKGNIYSLSDNSDVYVNAKRTPETLINPRDVRYLAPSFSEFIDNLIVTDELI